MNKTHQNALIAIDGGGTSCRIALLLGEKKTVVTVGAANVSSDFAGAVQRIKMGLELVTAKAGVPAETLWQYTAYFGLAGLLDKAAASNIKREFSFKHICVEDDQRAGVAGALGDRDGFVAGIGTGAYYAHKNGADLRIVGGWGIHLADEASGAWLGVHLLNVVLAVSDGLRAASKLSEQVFQQFDNAQNSVVAFSQKALPTEFAQFAPLIVKAAQQNDNIAVGLMQKGADHITSNLKALGWQSGAPICLMGGLAPFYRPYLPAELQTALIEPQSSALDGALQLAARLAQQNEGAAP